MRTISCAYLVEAAQAPLARARRIHIQNDRVQAVDSAAPEQVQPLFALPALVNAHDHGRAVRTSSIGAAEGGQRSVSSDVSRQ